MGNTRFLTQREICCECSLLCFPLWSLLFPTPIFIKVIILLGKVSLNPKNLCKYGHKTIPFREFDRSASSWVLSESSACTQRWVYHRYNCSSGGAPLTDLTRVLRWNRSEPEPQINGVEPPPPPRLSLWQQQQQQRHLTLLLLFGLSSAFPFHLLHQHVCETPANTGIRSQRMPLLLHFFATSGHERYKWEPGVTHDTSVPRRSRWSHILFRLGFAAAVTRAASEPPTPTASYFPEHFRTVVSVIERTVQIRQPGKSCSHGFWCLLDHALFPGLKYNGYKVGFAMLTALHVCLVPVLQPRVTA